MNHCFDVSMQTQLEFGKRVQDLINAFANLDLDYISNTYYHECTPRYADADGPFQTWPQYKQWLSIVFDLVNKQTFDVRCTWTYKIKEDVAITTTILDANASIGDTKVSGIFRLSFVWIKDCYSWKVVHEHFSQYSGMLAEPVQAECIKRNCKN